MAEALTAAGVASDAQGAPNLAVNYIGEAVGLLDAKIPEHWNMLAISHRFMGGAYAKLQKLEEAKKHLDISSLLREEVYKRDGSSLDLALFHVTRSEALEVAGERAEAARELGEAVAAYTAAGNHVAAEFYQRRKQELEHEMEK
ncbi:MAG: hypothetical protein AAB538_02680 [Patescibacteria group bacterium]